MSLNSVKAIPWAISLASMVFLAATAETGDASPQLEPPSDQLACTGDPIGGAERAYPPDPNSDIPWSGGMSGVADIQTAFNNARSAENAQLGLSIPMMTLPSQSTWNGMTDSEKAFWLTNRERIDRGVHAMHGVEPNVESVAQYYAQYLLDNDAWGHYADGNDPTGRLEDNPAINACHDSLSVSENLAVLATTGSSILLPVEQAMYNWMYKDAGSTWGHRHAILWYSYNDNSGTPGMEGFMGIGRAGGGPYQGPFDDPWPYAELIVMNVFDPCSSWNYGNDLIFEDGFELGNISAWN